MLTTLELESRTRVIQRDSRSQRKFNLLVPPARSVLKFLVDYHNSSQSLEKKGTRGRERAEFQSDYLHIGDELQFTDPGGGGRNGDAFAFHRRTREHTFHTLARNTIKHPTGAGRSSEVKLG